MIFPSRSVDAFSFLCGLDIRILTMVTRCLRPQYSLEVRPKEKERYNIFILICREDKEEEIQHFERKTDGTGSH